MESVSTSLAHSAGIDLIGKWRWFTAVMAVLVLPTMIIFVDETEIAIAERFGRITAVYDQPSQSGLHFKLPWPVEKVRRFDRRLQLLTPAGREAFTRDRKNVVVEAYLCWKIAEGQSKSILDRPVVRFFQGLGSVEVAESRLASRLQSILTEQIGRSELSELLKAAHSEAGPADGPSPLEQIAAKIRREFEQRADEDKSLSDRLGIEVVDIRIRRLNLPTGNMQAVFERMRSERQKIAERYRSAGLAENRMIRSQADRQSSELIARANADAERIRGEGEALAIHILNEAHAKDPEFASLLQTLESYQQILNDKTTLILSGTNSFLKLLMEGLPPQASEPTKMPVHADAQHPDNVRGADQ
ncbi:protease modulator HflC [Schlesneria sp. DSM 10557]|uniref:protease modulator HflC n=1 Tax=Schlesneria sp. DSM 10557 TaxID=3044399 RepID=UPI00359F91A2